MRRWWSSTRGASSVGLASLPFACRFRTADYGDVGPLLEQAGRMLLTDRERYPSERYKRFVRDFLNVLAPS